MYRLTFLLLFTLSINHLSAKDDNQLSDKLWKAVKDYVKETDTYKVVDMGRKTVKKYKKKIEKKIYRNKNK